MRPRAVGGLEPDDDDQRELVQLWHLSRTALSDKVATRSTRLDWVIAAFCREHPGVAQKWVYEWCWRYLGVFVNPDPIPEPPDGWPDGPTNARTVPTSTASKKRAKSRRPR